MKTIQIKDKLEEIDYPLESLSLGDFDYIGEYTAKKARGKDSDLYKSVGAFFRPNYERGLLLYSLVRRFKISSMLEIGFGRGYATLCAAMAMTDEGICGDITTVDPSLNEEFVKQLTTVFPKEWFERIKFCAGTSDAAFETMREEAKYDLVYIDGDHRFEQVEKDWLNSEKRFSKFILFDDYHMPDKKEKDIEVSKVIDSISDYEKELIIMDRRIFLDDRGLKDDEINYGQVLITNPDFDKSEYILDW